MLRFLITILFSFFILFNVLSSHAKVLGAIATQHPLATKSAAKILKKGGNAMDASIAAALTLAVVEPYNSGLGAGGMALIWNAKTQKVTALDFREKAPLSANKNMYTQPGMPLKASQIGPFAIAVPGEVAGLAEIHQRWGELPWKALFEDAIQLAQRGFEDDYLKERVSKKQGCLRRDFDSSRIYRPFFNSHSNQAHPWASTIPSRNFKLWQQPELATSLKRLRDSGPQDFYTGKIANQIINNLRGKGAILTRKDLQDYQVIERNALAAKFPWGQVWGMPLPSSGGISILRGLKILHALTKKDINRLKQNWTPWMLGVFDLIFQTRNTQMGDPDFNDPMPIKTWLSHSLAKKDARSILKGEVLKSKTNLSAKTEGHTTHLSILDHLGNAVSMTLTHNLSFGSCVTAGETGILMNNQMDDFATQPDRANAFGLVQSDKNAIAPSKRPLSSISPTLVTKKNQVILAIGSPGGPRIISSVFQSLVRYFFLKESLQDALAAPRIHFQNLPHQVFVETGVSPKIKNEIQKLKIPIKQQSSWSNVQAVALEPKTQNYQAMSDPRGIGQGLVVTRSVSQ